MGLLHMGQTLRISSHFSRHLRKADRGETYYLILSFRRKTKIGLDRNFRNQDKKQDVKQLHLQQLQYMTEQTGIQDICTVHSYW